jgi:hypothetical protein
MAATEISEIWGVSAIRLFDGYLIGEMVILVGLLKVFPFFCNKVRLLLGVFCNKKGGKNVTVNLFKC